MITWSKLNIFHYFYTQTTNPNDMQDVNLRKIVLVKQKKGGVHGVDNIKGGYPSKWLSQELGVNPSTVSKWCTNSSQPDIETLAKIGVIAWYKKAAIFQIRKVYTSLYIRYRSSCKR